jgi:predicted extracellular nuclease
MKVKFTFFLSLIVANLFAQSLEEAIERDRTNNSVRVVFYNVENLFDTIADANVADEEFLPNAVKAWDTKKYRIKIANTAKTIRAIGGWQAPEIVGLCEVENRSVLLSLANHNSLKGAAYNVLHFDSPDPRGIDVGLLYNSKLVHVLYARPIQVEMPNSRTRDILYAKLLIQQKDTLHLFVNHWSSRSGGKEESDYKRIAAAKTVKISTDSIYQKNENANILVMGDLNDGPRDESVKVLTEKSLTHSLNDLMENLPVTEGSHKYRGVWDYLDQILVSSSLLENAAGLQLVESSAYVGKLDFLLEEDDRYGDVYPKRTWKGDVFVGGFSDHLPVFCDLHFKK